MTQAELARALRVSQQTVFAYELGDRRVSLIMLCKLARIFSMSIEELAGMGKRPPIRKWRVSPAIRRQAERLQLLSKTQRRFVVRILDVLLDQQSSKFEAAATGSTRVDQNRQDRE